MTETNKFVDDDDVAAEAPSQAIVEASVVASSEQTTAAEDGEATTSATQYEYDEATSQSEPLVATINDAGDDNSDDDDDDEKEENSLIGQHVHVPPFGKGIVLEYRPDDQMYVIKLTSEERYQGTGMLYTRQIPTATTTVDLTENNQAVNNNAATAATTAIVVDDLNMALEKLETMRRLNLEVECHERGIVNVDFDLCTCCLKERGGSDISHFPRLQKLLDNTSDMELQDFPRLNSFFNTTSALASQTSNSLAAAAAASATAASTSVQPPPPNDAPNSDVDRAASNTHSVAVAASSVMEVTERPVQPPTAAAAQDVTTTSQAARMKTARTPVPASTPSPPQPPPVQSFPRLTKLWGSIQKLPQPVASAKSSSSPTTSATGTGGGGGLTTTAPSNSDNGPAPSNSTSSSFPRIRGLIDSTTTSSSSFFGSMSAFQSNTSNHSSGSSNPTNQTIDPAAAALLLRKPSTDSQTSSRTRASMEVSGNGGGKPKALPRIQKLMDQRQRASTSPCLICGSPSCPSHSSASFRREGITLCLSCERLFELDFIVDCVNKDATERSKSIDHMIDCYDRCLLMLHYSGRFVEPIAKSLEEQKEQQNKIGLASSGVGVLSGVLGIAAAASILTPAGPPLLIASLFFGGGATTVQTGSEALNYFSEPRKIADRVIALHGMALSLLRVTSTLRDAMLRDHIRTDVYEAEPMPLSEQVNEQMQKNRIAVLAGSNVGRTLTLGGVAGAEASAAGAAAATTGAVAVVGAEGTAAGAAAAGAGAARGATAFSRAGTAAARTVRFARFAGGALSAAVLVMEANAIQSTLKSINEGNPCDKAHTLRRVAAEIRDLPSTTELDDECRAYLDALNSRPEAPTATEVVAVAAGSSSTGTEDIPEANCQPAIASDELCTPGAMILDGDSSAIPAAEPVAEACSAPSLSSSSALFSSVSMSFGGDGASSLLQRFQTRQERQQDAHALRQDEVVATASDDDHPTAATRNTELNLVV